MTRYATPFRLALVLLVLFAGSLFWALGSTPSADSRSSSDLASEITPASFQQLIRQAAPEYEGVDVDYLRLATISQVS